MSRRKSGSTWRFEIAGDVLTATNKAMAYTIRLGVPYQLTEHARLASKGPTGPRSVTQFLDGGARLYTVGLERSARDGRAPARTVANVSSFVGTYLVPRVPLAPLATGESAPSNTDRLARLEQSVSEAITMLRSIVDALGVK